MPNNTIGEAYLQIKPSMDGISKDIQTAMGDAGSKGSSSFGSAFASGLKKLGTVALSAVGAATTAVGAFGAQAVSSFADYEQLAGGVETLFGNAYGSVEEYAKGIGVSLSEASNTWEDYQKRQQQVLNNASNAYKTSGMSANEYMETVTSFAASLNSSLGEYAWQSANYAETAMVAMADNANKMGTPLESIKNAYQGFAKGNFTMLDNLKLGYGGTKQEMERLLATAEKLAGYEEGAFSVDNFADIIDAIDIIQEDLGITGTTAKEASTTIAGSAAAVSAAWQNVIAAIGKGEGLTETIDALYNSIFGEKSGEGLLNQIIPRVKTVIEGVGDFIAKAGPIIAAEVPKLVSTVLPVLTQSASTTLDTVISVITAILPDLVASLLPVVASSAISLIGSLAKVLIDCLPILAEVALQAILELAQGLAEALPAMIPYIVEVVLGIANYLVDNIDLLIDAAIQLIIGLAEGLINAVPILLEKLPIIILKIVAGILEGIPKVIVAGLEIIGALWKGIKEGIFGASNWGSDLVMNFINGIKSKVKAVGEAIKGVGDMIKSLIGFSEPDEGPLSNFHTYAPDMMRLFAQGIKDNESLVYDQIADTFDFGGKLGDFGMVAEGTQNLNLGGTIRLEGVNNQGEFVAASEYAIEEIITNIMKREARLA